MPYIVEANYTGNDLLKACDESDYSNSNTRNVDFVLVRECGSYIKGVIDSYYALNSLMNDVKGICIPSGVTNGQIFKIVHKYLKDNPAELHKIAAGRVLISMMDAFPCKESSSQESKTKQNEDN